MVVRATRVRQHLGLDCAAAEELHPLAVVIHLHLQRRVREGEVAVDPTVLVVAENVVDETLHNALHVVDDAIGVRFGKGADDFHLRENWIVRPVHLITTIRVSHNDKRLDSLRQQLHLVGTRMGTEHMGRVHIVSIALPTTDVVFRNQNVVERLLCCDNGREVLKHLKFILVLVIEKRKNRFL